MAWGLSHYPRPLYLLSPVRISDWMWYSMGYRSKIWLELKKSCCRVERWQHNDNDGSVYMMITSYPLFITQWVSILNYVVPIRSTTLLPLKWKTLSTSQNLYLIISKLVYMIMFYSCGASRLLGWGWIKSATSTPNANQSFPSNRSSILYLFIRN